MYYPDAAFGLAPLIGNGQVPVILKLLSAARRPVRKKES
jgi:hypothetical protein